ncbi:MAG: hypothetical protein AVDCRST_MAG08-2005, partial [uncultured Acetobacteraceae bacterium]
AHRPTLHPAPARPRGDVPAADLRVARQEPAAGHRAGHHRGPAAGSGVVGILRRARGFRLARLPARLRQLHRAVRRAQDQPSGAGDAGLRPGGRVGRPPPAVRPVGHRRRWRRGRVHAGELAPPRTLFAAPVHPVGVLHQADGGPRRAGACGFAGPAADGVVGLARDAADRRRRMLRLRLGAGAAPQRVRRRPRPGALVPIVGLRDDARFRNARPRPARPVAGVLRVQRAANGVHLVFRGLPDSARLQPGRRGLRLFRGDAGGRAGARPLGMARQRPRGAKGGHGRARAGHGGEFRVDGPLRPAVAGAAGRSRRLGAERDGDVLARRALGRDRPPRARGLARRGDRRRAVLRPGRRPGAAAGLRPPPGRDGQPRRRLRGVRRAGAAGGGGPVADRGAAGPSGL